MNLSVSCNTCGIELSIVAVLDGDEEIVLSVDSRHECSLLNRIHIQEPSVMDISQEARTS